MLRERLTAIVRAALGDAFADGSLPAPPGGADALLLGEILSGQGRGDDTGYTTDVPLALARARREPDRAAEFAAALAEKLNGLPEAQSLLSVAAEPVSGGMVALRPRPEAFVAAFQNARKAGADFGHSDQGQGKRVLVEFVSANPNGPITVAHGRGGAMGDALASLLTWTGWKAEREFYVNDATNSKQMRVFARSVFARYRQLLGQDDPIPEDGYPGEYVAEVARAFYDEKGDALANVSPEPASEELLGFALERMLGEQKEVLSAFGTEYDHWFSEQTLRERGALAETLEALRQSGNAYEEGGAIWLRSTAFGDSVDRVLVRTDGTPTYLAGDLAYHRDKFERGFDLAIDVWGAEHQGYVGRTEAGLAALGYAPERLHVALFQGVRLLKDGSEVKSGRLTSGVVTLEELLDELGAEAARFFFLLRPADSPLDIDLDIARRQDRSNPFFLVRSALARSAEHSATNANAGTPGPEDTALVAKIDAFPGEVATAAATYAPHRIARYALDLATLLHASLDRTSTSPAIAVARQTLLSALSILGIRGE